MKDCVFCKIASHKGRKFEYESGNFVAFPDIHPSAPVHLLIVSKKHYSDITQVPDALWIEVKSIAEKLQKKLGLKGFRLATNTGDLVMVSHMHVHFLAGFTKERAI